MVGESQLSVLQALTAPACMSCNQSCTDAHVETCKHCSGILHPVAPCSTTHDDGIYCSLCMVQKNIQEQRNGAKRHLQDQADRMVLASRQRF